MRVSHPHADTIGAAAGSPFAAIKNVSPEGIRYGAYRAGGTDAFVVLLELEERTGTPYRPSGPSRRIAEDGGWPSRP